MRGADVTQERLFTIRRTTDFVPEGHPLIAVREILNRALRGMDRLFDTMYADSGRDSVPPERLLRGLVLQALYGIRSERLLCEQLGYNLLYRWFVGLGMEDAAWDHSTYTQNRDRLIGHEAVRALFGQVMQQAREADLLSDEHFSVDGTLIRAWASHKSFVPKDGPPGSRRKTVGADKGYDSADFVDGCRARRVTPHVAQNHYEYITQTGKRARRNSALDARTTRHAGYGISQTVRKVIETLFGDGKQHGGTIRQVKLRGRDKVSDVFTLAMLTVNLRRLPKLMAAQADRAGAT